MESEGNSYVMNTADVHRINRRRERWKIEGTKEIGVGVVAVDEL
jgi:hypothetical protein